MCKIQQSTISHNAVNVTWPSSSDFDRLLAIYFLDNAAKNVGKICIILKNIGIYLFIGNFYWVKPETLSSVELFIKNGA